MMTIQDDSCRLKCNLRLVTYLVLLGSSRPLQPLNNRGKINIKMTITKMVNEKEIYCFFTIINILYYSVILQNHSNLLLKYSHFNNFLSRICNMSGFILVLIFFTDDKHRPYLTSRVEGTNDYINAIFLDVSCTWLLYLLR